MAEVTDHTASIARLEERLSEIVTMLNDMQTGTDGDRPTVCIAVSSVVLILSVVTISSRLQSVQESRSAQAKLNRSHHTGGVSRFVTDSG
jgi:hypothetical protein